MVKTLRGEVVGAVVLAGRVLAAIHASTRQLNWQ